MNLGLSSNIFYVDINFRMKLYMLNRPKGSSINNAMTIRGGITSIKDLVTGVCPKWVDNIYYIIIDILDI